MPVNQDAEYIDDELVPSSYYADEHTPEECMSCKETGLRMVDLDKQVTTNKHMAVKCHQI